MTSSKEKYVLLIHNHVFQSSDTIITEHLSYACSMKNSLDIAYANVKIDELAK
jgi:hypothetical protein